MAETRDAAAVFERHLRAFVAGDLGAILADYAPDAVLCLPDKTARGIEELRALFAQLAASPGQTQFEVLRQEVHGDCVYLAWRATSPALDPSVGADAFASGTGRSSSSPSAGRST